MHQPHGASPASSGTAWSDLVDPLDEAPSCIRTAWQDAGSALQREDFSSAKRALQQALDSVRTEGPSNPELERRLRGSLVAVLLALGEEVLISDVRTLLAEAETLGTSMVAAYQLGRMFELRQEWKKALFYAQVALTSADSAGRPAWQAVANNLIGNVLVAESRFNEAIPHYLAVLDSDQIGELERAQAADNLGFALTTLHRLHEARPYFASALKTLRRVDGPARLSVELDLALFHLLDQKPERALRIAHIALLRSQELEDSRGRANALLLLSQAAKESGNVLVARRSVAELTEIYDAEFAAALFTFDVLEVVNLKA